MVTIYLPDDLRYYAYMEIVVDTVADVRVKFRFGEADYFMVREADGSLYTELIQ